MNDFGFNLFKELSGVKLEMLNPLGYDISDNDLKVIMVHNQDKDCHIIKKLWLKQDLTSDELLFKEMFQNCLLGLESIDTVVYRYELKIHYDEILKRQFLEELQNCHLNNIPFVNRGFWNFSDDPRRWKIYHNVGEHIQFNLTPKTNSNVKKTYIYYNQDQSENEVVVPIGTKFKIDRMDGNIISICEM